MPYTIEVMAIGDDLYPILERSAAELNGVQDQFRFQPSPSTERAKGLAFARTEYLTTDVFEFLRGSRRISGGNRPYIVAFVSNLLKSAKYANLFGSHEGEEGLAVVTVADAEHYVKAINRYCCYYLTRYALSFVNPHIKAHTGEDRKQCYFHFKRFKPDIRLSMNSGFICDLCRDALETPPAEHSSAHKLSADESVALAKMRDYVSGALPYALVMKGGGVKGLAFAGALSELEKHFWFDRHVGASAGAIAAVLLAAGYSPTELTSLLREKPFADFMDAPWWKVPFNLLIHQGAFPGEACRLWIADLLTRKYQTMSEVKMCALEGALVFAAREKDGTIAFDSRGERKESFAAFAARCSMSVPAFFFPVTVDGRRVYDGGIRNNFPLTRYLSLEPKANFIALYLGKPDNSIARGWVGLDLIDIAVEGEERKTVDSHPGKVITIDTSPIKMLDFRLSDLEKDFLVDLGRAAALKFLHQRQVDDGPIRQDVETAQRKVDEARTTISLLRAERRNSTLRMIALAASAIIGAIAALYFLW